MNWNDYIIADKNICHGKACIKGTRIMVAAIKYAADLASDRLLSVI